MLRSTGRSSRLGGAGLLAALAIAAIYLPAAFEVSRLKPLWHDELYTLSISQAPTVRDIWADLRTYDLNPPLIYVLTHYAYRLLGVNTLATRLPEIAAFLVFLWSVFWFGRRRLGTMYSLVVVGALLQPEIFGLAVEARPYALMLAFLGVAMLAWQTASDEDAAGSSRRRMRGLVMFLLLGAGCGMLLSHVFAIPALMALAGAELWRTRLRGAVDWPVTLVLLCPFVVIAASLPMLHNHAGGVYPTAFQPTPDSILDYYRYVLAQELIGLGGAAIAVRLVLGPNHLGGFCRGEGWFFTKPEWFLIFALLGIPLLIQISLMVTHGAFFARYGVAGEVGTALLGAAVFARCTRTEAGMEGRAALLAAGAFLVMSNVLSAIPRAVAAGAFFPTVRNSEPPIAPCESCLRSAAVDASLPLVDASGLTFIEMNHRESAETLQRVYYLTDGAARERHAHANIFEGMPVVIRRFGLRGHAEEYAKFIGEHPHFFVLGTFHYPEDWLLPKLTEEGAEVRLLGEVHDTYRDTELYEVSLVRKTAPSN